MHHDVFGEIEYSQDEQGWTGSCRLPVFDEYQVLDLEPESDLPRGSFRLAIPDDKGSGPSAAQVSACRFLLEHETDVCHAVMTQVLSAARDPVGPVDWLIAWANRRRDSRWWGWLYKVIGPEYKTAEDLKRAARCVSVEISHLHAGGYAYIAFSFDTIWGLGADQGFLVLFHPEKGTSCGSVHTIYDAAEAENEA